MTATDDGPEGLTLVVLTRNRLPLLRGCLDSLLAQENPGIPLEFVVVDDGSSDGTAEMVRSLASSHPHWSYVRQEHRGIAAARNAGIRAARTSWLAIVADDYLLPADYARSVAAFFRERPEARVVRFRVVADCGGIRGVAIRAYLEASEIRRLYFPGGRRSGLWRRQAAPEAVVTHHGLEAAGAAAFHRSVFRRVGLFDESFPRGEDSEFTARLRQAGIPVHYSPFVHIRHRCDPSLGKAMKAAFAGGRASWRLQAAAERPRAGRVLTVGLLAVPLAAYWSLWRSWQAVPVYHLPLLWPLLMLLELSNRAGYFRECARSLAPGGVG